MDGDAESSAHPPEDIGGVSNGPGVDCSSKASTSCSATSKLLVTVIFKAGRSGIRSAHSFEALEKAPKTLNLPLLIDFVVDVSCVALILDLFELLLRREPSDSLAFRSRRSPTVSDSRGFFIET